MRPRAASHAQGGVAREDMLAPTRGQPTTPVLEKGWTDGYPHSAHAEGWSACSPARRPRDEQVGEIFNHDTKELISTPS